MTRQGRLAVLTNFREEGEIIQGERSRGELPKMFLGVPQDSSETPAEFAERLVEGEGVQGVGGFSLVFGQLGNALPADANATREIPRSGRLGIVSNRMKEAREVAWLEDGTWGLSNSHYGDRTWPKVVQGERLLDEAVEQSLDAHEASEELAERCFAVLSTDTLPEWQAGEDWITFVKELRNSIFIPRIGADTGTDKPAADKIAAAEGTKPVSVMSGMYGTQKQTVILVDRRGHVTFIERTLCDEHGKDMLEKDRDRRFDFDIEGWV